LSIRPEKENHATLETLVVRGGRNVKLLTDPIMFEEENLPGFVRAGLYTVAGLLVAFVLWASVTRLDEIASASGSVVPGPGVKLVQHVEGGMIASIDVAEGDLVEEGQVLARLDPKSVQSDYNEMQARYAGLLLRDERLKATVEKRNPDFTKIGAGHPDLVADQTKLWEGQLAAQKSAREVVLSQIEQRRKELTQLRGQLATANKQLALASDQAGIRQQGVDAGVVSRQTFLETKRAEVTAEGEVNRLDEQIHVATDALQEAEKRHQNLGETQVQDASSELGTVSNEMEQVKNALVKLQDRVDRLAIRAPAKGIVQDLKIRTVGEVLPAAGTLCRIVPVNDILEAEVRISPADIGHVELHQPVKIKVASYEYVRYGTLKGTLKRISATTFTDEQGKPYYKALVTLERAWMGPREGQNAILPGMAVEADIVTGNKSLIQYLLKPIFVSLKNSFHER
jgi:HlyD family secretion protein/adhesin transport system membrane fusion protein